MRLNCVKSIILSYKIFLVLNLLHALIKTFPGYETNQLSIAFIRTELDSDQKRKRAQKHNRIESCIIFTPITQSTNKRNFQSTLYTRAIFFSLHNSSSSR